MTPDDTKLQAFLGKVVGDVGAAMSAALVVLGDRLGLYRGMADGAPVTPGELAKRTDTSERYVREWLDGQAAAGYVMYDAETRRYSLPLEHAVALTDRDSPAFVPGLYQVTAAIWAAESRIAERFKTGEGLCWGEHHPCLFEGTERFFRSGYLGNLLSSWIPALDGVEAKLKAGARVADVGCGLGASTILMAKTFPQSRFWGFDSHVKSIELARQRAVEAGVADRVVFEVAKATDYPGKDYDLVAHFDCLHDMEDPVGAARHVNETLAKDGTWMIVEPFAHDSLAANLNPVGRIYYAASTFVCTPASQSQEVGLGLGAQAGEARLRGVVTSGGFTRFRRAAETPFNIVLEARP
jgi:SAM-dependent methyltransferase